VTPASAVIVIGWSMPQAMNIAVGVGITDRVA